MRRISEIVESNVKQKARGFLFFYRRFFVVVVKILKDLMYFEEINQARRS